MSDVWMQTMSGKRLDFLEPEVDQIELNDIAWALSNINRFTGHLTPPYSVAAHSYYAARVAINMKYPIDTVKWALMHDAAEAYIGDISRPLKAAIGPIIKSIEARILETVRDRFNLPHYVPPEIKLIDNSLGTMEAENWLGGFVDDWPNQSPERLVIDILHPIDNIMAYHLFLGQAKELGIS